MSRVFWFKRENGIISLESRTIMSIGEQLTEDMKTSMRAGNTVRTGTLRLLRAAMKNEEIKLGHPLDEAEELKLLQREAKQRRDSIEQYNDAGRSELADHEQVELDIILGYLPEPISEVELSAIIDEVITAQGATDMKQMGAVVGAVMHRVGVRAEGGAVSKLVRERLSS